VTNRDAVKAVAASARITADLLQKHGACRNAVSDFRKLFPNGATVTVANAMRCACAELDFDWAARRLLSAPAQAAYNRDMAPSRAAYNQAKATAWAAYNRAPSRAAYDQAVAPPRAAYDQAKATARAAYWKVAAMAFVKAWDKGRGARP
jgi:hypothetical protein